MEPPLTALRPQTLIFTGLGMRQPCGLNNFAIAIAIAIALRLTARSRARAWGSPQEDPPARPRRPDAWRSYAVYSGALSVRDHKSSRRDP